jgi:hypothetical protein
MSGGGETEKLQSNMKEKKKNAKMKLRFLLAVT